MRIAFEDIPLGSQERDLLASMVEAERSQEGRHPFMVAKFYSGTFLDHPGLDDEFPVYPGDLSSLQEYSLLRVSYTSRGNEIYDVTPIGKQYYEWMKQQEGEAVHRVEDEVRRLLDRGTFGERHPVAYKRWAAAEDDLWGAETPAEFTEIGHACREAVQQLVTDLVALHRPEGVNPEPQSTIDRLRAVMKAARLSESLEAFAAALLAYYGTVSDLIMRQEHGAQREGEALKWEDARRVVFQTAIVMFELDRALGDAATRPQKSSE